jgi:hypothetical protein
MLNIIFAGLSTAIILRRTMLLGLPGPVTGQMFCHVL